MENINRISLYDIFPVENSSQVNTESPTVALNEPTVVAAGTSKTNKYLQVILLLISTGAIIYWMHRTANSLRNKDSEEKTL